VAVIAAGLCIHPYVFLSVFALITGLLLWEFYGLMNRFENASLLRIAGALGGVYLFFACFMYASGKSDADIFLPYLLFIVYILISGLYERAPNPIRNWAYLFMGQVYCAGLLSLLNFIVFASAPGVGFCESSLFVQALFVIVWLNDSGAYLIGSKFGRRRLFERVSPKKSWEGFFVGLVLALAFSQVLAWYAPAVSGYQWLGFAATVVVFATWGDLNESLLKRTLGVKDSGKLLPGHGGLLDRFDSILLAIPALYIYIRLFIRN
jgi:phosphatidate cytidylyltransferase